MPITPRALAAGIALLLLGHRGLAAGTNGDLNGFYFVSTNGTGPEVRIDEGRTTWGAHPPIYAENWRIVRLGEKAGIKVTGASVFADNDENILLTLEMSVDAEFAVKPSVFKDYFNARLQSTHETEMRWYFTTEPTRLAVQRAPARFPIRFWPSGD
jgi:hypothetical protein